MTGHRGFSYLLFVTVTFLSACASTMSSKRIATLEAALGDTSKLEKLCADDRPAACALLGKIAKPVHILPIMQGVSSHEQARLVVVAPAGSGLTYFVVGPLGPRKIAPEAVKHPGSKFEAVHIEPFDLKLGESYELVVVDSNGQLWDRRTFKALDLKKKQARFVLTSCMDDTLIDVQKRIWPEVLEQKPDAIVMLGDNVYADWVGEKKRPITEPLQIWQRYVDTRSRLEIYRANPLVPIVATWDDHDFGKNDGDRTFAFKEQSREIFYAFFDQRKDAPGFESGPGVASWWKAFGVQFALLDDRSFRSPNGADLPDQTHLGPDQEDWLKEGLAAAQLPVFMASGDQFFGGYHAFESFEGSHPKSFKAQLARWRRSTMQPIVFLSGDRHLTEIMKVPRENLGYPTYEITSSGIHAPVYAGAFAKSPSPLQLAGKDGDYNYSIIEIVESAPKKLNLNVKSFGLDKKLLYEQNLTVKR